MASRWPVMGLRSTSESSSSGRIAEREPTAPVGRLKEVTAGLTTRDPVSEIKFQVYEQLLRELDLSRIQQMQGAELRQAVDEATVVMLQSRDILLSRLDRQRLVREI